MQFKDYEMCSLWTALIAVRSQHLMLDQSIQGYEIMWKGEIRIIECPVDGLVADCLGWVMESMVAGAKIEDIAETSIYFRGLNIGAPAFALDIFVSERNFVIRPISIEEWGEAEKGVA